MSIIVQQWNWQSYMTEFKIATSNYMSIIVQQMELAKLYDRI